MIQSINTHHLFHDELTTDFSSPAFQRAFQQYFAELDIHVSDWEGLFREMNGGGNAAFVRTDSEGAVVGFLLSCPITFTSWFFEGTCGFIREFWVADGFRAQGHGSALLRMAESHFLKTGVHTSILTTDTAPDFYKKHGYSPAPGCTAKNGDPVFIKWLSQSAASLYSQHT